jgi:hypothetical protein
VAIQPSQAQLDIYNPVVFMLGLQGVVYSIGEVQHIYLNLDFIGLIVAATIARMEKSCQRDHKSLMNCSIFLIIIYLSVNLEIYFNGPIVWKG